MRGKLKQGTETAEERQKVLVPVRRHETEKEAEQEIQEEPRAREQWKIPRQWYDY